MTRAIAIVSGGMDSVTLAYLLKHEGHDLHLLGFDYGQRHRRELDYARRAANVLDADFDCVDLTSLTPLLTGSALTDTTVPVPEGHYADASMRATVVPNRNAVMLSIAYAVAVAEAADVVALGIHAGDHPIYPDCRPDFATAFAQMQRVATQGYSSPTLRLYVPFVEKSKADIVVIGTALGVPYEYTWSCYNGGDQHCGKCGTCVERKEAFQIAGVSDPTSYREETS